MAASARHISGTAIIPKRCRERFLDLSTGGARALRDAGVLMAGISDLVPPYEMARTDPSHHVILYTVGGSARWQASKTTKRLGSGTMWVGPAGVPHRYVSGPSWRIAWFHLSPEGMWKALPDAAPATHRVDTVQQLIPAMEGYISESIRGDAFAMQAAARYSELIALLIERDLVGGEDAAAMRARAELDALWNDVHGDLAYPWTVAMLAGKIHVSPVQLHRLTQRYHGITPMGMVTRLRMRRAEDLLRHTDYPLKLIADVIGYETPFAFSRAFKRFAGVSPRGFRRRGRP